MGHGPWGFNPNNVGGAQFRGFDRGEHERFEHSGFRFYPPVVFNNFNAMPVGGYFRPAWAMYGPPCNKALAWASLFAALGMTAQALSNGAPQPGYVPAGYQPPAPVAPPPPALAQGAPPPLAPDAMNQYNGFRQYAAQSGRFDVVQSLDAIVQDPNFAQLSPQAQTETMRSLVDNPYSFVAVRNALQMAASRGVLPTLNQALLDPGFQQNFQRSPAYAVAMLQPTMPPPGTPQGPQNA